MQTEPLAFIDGAWRLDVGSRITVSFDLICIKFCWHFVLVLELLFVALPDLIVLQVFFNICSERELTCHFP